MKKLRVIALFVVLAMFVAACGGDDDDEASSSASDDNTTEATAASADMPSIKVAYLYDLVGPAATANEAQIRGVDLAVKELREAGIIDIELKRTDTEGDVARATALTQENAADDDVLVQLGPANTPEFFAAIPLAEQLEFPVYSLISAGVYTGEFNPFTFRSGFTDAQALPPLLEYAQDEFDADKIGLLFVNDNDYGRYSSDLIKTQAEEMGMEVVDESFATPDVSFDTQARSIASADVDAVFLVALPAQIGFATKALRDAGVEAPLLASNNSVGGGPQVLETSAGTAAGMIVSSAYDFTADRPAITSYLEAFSGEYGDTPPGLDAFGYDAVHVIADAVSKIEGEITRESFAAAMAEVEVDGVTGTLTFPEGYGDIAREGVFVLKLQDDGTLTPA